jgi:hypothetical protein
MQRKLVGTRFMEKSHKFATLRQSSDWRC